MHFFDQQSRARKQTFLLFTLYLLVMLAMIHVSYSFVDACLQLHQEQNPPDVTPWLFLLSAPFAFRGPLDLTLLASITLTVVFLITISAVLVVRRQKENGSKMAMSLGSTQVIPVRAGKYARRYYNVVEEMAVASGVRVPGVYLMEHEKGINAFTVGWTSGNTTICITQGMLDQLSRDELQGVIAHEFSHILHGDTRFNLQVMGLLSGSFVLTCVSWVFAGVLLGSILAPFFISVIAGQTLILPLIFIPALLYEYNLLNVVLGITLGLATICFINLLFVTYLKRAILRQREYLADASAVQWTRFPQGIIGALQKIDKAQFGSQIFHSKASRVGHITFASIVRKENFFSAWLDTHPAIHSRIKAIESRKKFWPEAPVEGFDAKKVERRKEIPDIPLKSVTNWFANIPEDLRLIAEDPAQAAPLVYALFLDKNREIRKKQLQLIANHADRQLAESVLQHVSRTDSFDEQFKVSLAEVSFPSLRAFSPDQYHRFRKIIQALIKADGKIDLFEYTFLALLTRDLDALFNMAEPHQIHYFSTQAVLTSFIIVLSRVTYAGNTGDGNLLKSYNEGLHVFGLRRPILPRSECDFGKFDVALKKLATASPPIKKRTLRALTACIMADKVVTLRERELLRAISAMLGFPMPILIDRET